MIKDYLKLPLRFTALFEGAQLPVCNMLDSIYRNLHLIITTATQENQSDEQYGVAFWENDYDIHMSNDMRKTQITDDLRAQIQRYEKRITEVAIQVSVQQSLLRIEGNESLRRRVEITISGKVKRSSEPFSFRTGFFIGPFLLG